jgi:quercetin dioxygenase-like cupin family protein
MTFRLILAAWAAAVGSYALVIAVDTPPRSEAAVPQFQRAIPNLPGKTFTAAIVNFPPGAKAASHRHGNAFVYAYVLSGTIRSQLDAEPAKVYRTGEDWFEPPGAHHKLAENVSGSEPAKLLAIFIANTGDELKIPDQP